MSKYFFTLLLFLPFFVQSQAVKDIAIKASKEAVQKDTVIIIREVGVESVNNNYQQILEKTNSQLSLWSNPYGVLIGIIGVLVALLAIAVAFAIYKQSKDAKELMAESLSKHEIALENLIAEKNSNLIIYETTLSNLIREYQEKLTNPLDEERKNQIKEIISRLEEQKEFVNLKTYTHSRWDPKDIPENYPINEATVLMAKISLNYPSQTFVIYVRVVASDGQKYWLGFAGGTQQETETGKHEYTQKKIYNLTEVTIQENIVSVFKRGFPDLSPIRIDNIRLRGSNVDYGNVTFSYKIS